MKTYHELKAWLESKLRPTAASLPVFARWTVVAGFLFATFGRVCGQTRAAPSPQNLREQTQAELNALQTLMIRVEAQLPRQPKVSATKVHTVGYWDTKELTTAWYGIMRRFLPTVRGAHPEVLTYWVMRTDGSDWVTRTDGFTRANGFAAQARSVVSSIPAVAPLAARLQDASGALIKEENQSELLRVSSAPKQELAKMYAALDLPGKRWNLILVVRDILRSASEAGPSAWQPIYQFLRNDADAQWNAGIRERDEKQRVTSAMTKAFWKATEPPAAATVHFEKLEVLSSKIELLRDQAIESALSPGQNTHGISRERCACVYQRPDRI